MFSLMPLSNYLIRQLQDGFASLLRVNFLILQIPLGDLVHIFISPDERIVLPARETAPPPNRLQFSG